MKCSGGLCYRESKSIRIYTDGFTHLFNFVIYVFSLLCLCILIVIYVLFSIFVFIVQTSTLVYPD